MTTWQTFIYGYAVGTCVMLFIAVVLAKLDHAAWLKLCDRYEAVIKRLRERRKNDPADWWKQN